MTPRTSTGTAPAGAPSRRSFLASTAVAAVAVSGGASLLTACGSPGGGKDGTTSGKDAKKVLPTFMARTIVAPDIPSEHGSSLGFHKALSSDQLKSAVPEKLGKGQKITVMSPYWGSPPKQDNPYYKAANEAIGVDITWQNQDGMHYDEKLGAVLASSRIPDVVVIPGWNMGGKIPSAIINKFADLGPYLSGDKVKKYPNLAAIPTDAWQRAIFGGKLRGLPMPASYVPNIVPYYRSDLFEEKGYEVPTSPQEFLDLAKEITHAKAKVWGCGDMKWTSFNVFGVFSGEEKALGWNMVDGKLLYRIEQEEYLEALEWARKLYAAGVVHPDAKAQQGDDATRFTAGQVLMYNDDISHWYGKTAEQLPQNPKFTMSGMDIFGPDGGKPVLYAKQPAGIFAFVSKNADKSAIEAALAAANFTASPYGTKEYMLTNYGVEGTHYDIKNGLPVKNDKGNNEVNNAYVMLASPASTLAHPDLPQITRDQVAWQQRHGALTRKTSFYGLQVTEPAKYTNLSNDMEGMEDEVVRGRKSIADMQQFISTWRSKGGDQLRDWYKKLLDDAGSAANR
ncbi:extracellular solute-binding protein [Streptomyces sp. TRM66268-LWL]|uniref:Extracellular solute-binding protein n=1 Tax=Streptomyces polyasparticus TaxID=2767826 RepID=A0ABR7SRH4_9ACTN|nr:extracellular solute-binding protein [Streptomyces polyasparticus]MBC9716923.1 extracellular solute-binding protein [Streptomyces polyasparticus]